MATADAKLITVEEFLALPDDGVDRMLVDGVVWELGMTMRRWLHAAVQANVTLLLNHWVKQQPQPRGRVVDGDAGFRLATGTMVGINVAYVSAGLAAATPESQAYFDGSPTLAVEVLSPSDRLENVDRKVETYLEAGVPLVWVVHPRARTITVYRPDALPKMFTVEDEIAGEGLLPGFRAAVSDVFD